MTTVTRSYKVGFKAARAALSAANAVSGAAKFVGGIACGAICGPAVAIGHVSGNFIDGAVHAVRQRNPKPADDSVSSEPLDANQPKPKSKRVSGKAVKVSEPDVVLNTTYHEI